MFTDVEGSTRLWEDHPDVMHDVLARHDEIVRGAIESHAGYVVKTTGDGFHAAFGTARDALEAALAAQQALAGEPPVQGVVVKVRMGVHTGEARVRDGDYYGSELNRAARLMAVGHGGQVLVSEVTHRLGPDVAAVDLGSHHLKDVGEVGIWQLTHPSLRRDFPPLRTLTVTNNLPAPVDSFVGRRAELADVLDALGDCRLVTLTGPGGSGKTRLALEAATAALSSYRNGVWFVSLAVAGNGERVVPLVAAELGVPEATDEPVADTLERWLRDRELLLVLDNCEPVVGAVASFAERYLARCAGVRILATSREVLGVRGERALGTPPLNVADDPARAGESDAVELFMVRASAAAPGFDADAADVATVAQICRRLDGLPLAIELAAARLRALSLEQVATRLDDRFRLLGAGERTLEAVVAWSYDLLTEAEREVFVRLAVFPADFSLEATEMVVSDAVVEEGDVLDLLTRLVEKSLVTTVMSGDTYRYRLLETLRDYALARLDERRRGRSVERPAARVGHDARRVRGGVVAPTGARRGAGVSPRRSRHVAGGDGLGEPPRRPARRVADRLGGTHRPRRRTTPDHHAHCSSDSDPESNRGSWGTPTARSGTSRSSRAIGRHHPNPRRPPSSSSCSRGPHGTPLGPRTSVSTGLGAPAT